MGTFSVGQATREKFRFTWEFRLVGARVKASIADRARSIDRSALVLIAEGALSVFCYVLAIVLIAPGRGFSWALEALRSTLGIALAVPLILSVATRLYRRSLRHAGAVDLIHVAKVVWLSAIIFTAVVCWEFPRLDLPAAVFVVNAALLQITWGALPFGPRAVRVQRAAGRATGKRALIVGAGDAGVTVLKELALDPDSSSRPVVLVDDDPQKWGRTCCGIPIAGGTRHLARIAAASEADEILICIPSATHRQMHDILEASRRSNVPVRSLPSLNELMRSPSRGSVSRRDLRSARIEDLLQRDEIAVDENETRKTVGGKVVLVSGAGGSIGSELCHQIAAAGPSRLLLVDKSENSLFYVHREITERLRDLHATPILVDITDRARIAQILRDERPDIVFHAAAYKHVAMLERYPLEAIRNNVLGTRNLAEAAIECGAARFINISTDKAVAPRNYMGLSKKITELFVQELARGAATTFSSVRFGNVAGSTGSVLRLFWDQIQNGGPVRVTDPRATRYFMSISEAVHLILRAAAIGAGGETFVFDMGAPLNICELAKTMMLFAGVRPGVDIPIEFIGLQEGEKLTEELWEIWEKPAPTAFSRILAIRNDDPRARGIVAKIGRMEDLFSRGENDRLLQYLHHSFPDFRPKGPSVAARPAAAVPAPVSIPIRPAIRMVGAA